MQAASAPPTCIHDYYEMRGAKRLEADCKERVAAIAPLEPFEGDSVFRLANDGSCELADPATLGSGEIYQFGESLDPDAVLGRIDVELP